MFGIIHHKATKVQRGLMRRIFCTRLMAAMFFLASAAAWSAGPFFSILDYGARNDGSAPATEAFRSAIQAAKAAG
jgi:hypothetical protein